MANVSNILNMAFVDSYVIYCHVLSAQHKPMNRSDFMKKLSTKLTAPWMTKRWEALTLPRHVLESSTNIVGHRIPGITGDQPAAKKYHIVIIVHRREESLRWVVQNVKKLFVVNAKLMLVLTVSKCLIFLYFSYTDYLLIN